MAYVILISGAVATHLTLLLVHLPICSGDQKATAELFFVGLSDKTTQQLLFGHQNR
jgi:hypothetical protein